MRFQNVVNAFSAGLLTPRLSLRSDSERYAQGLRQAINWIISPHGGALFRRGSEFTGNPATNAEFRLFQFHRGGDVSDIQIEVTGGRVAGEPGLIRYWIDGVLFETGAAIQLFDEADFDDLFDEADGLFLISEAATNDNPYSQDELDELYFVNQDTFGVLCHPDHAPFYITLQKDGTILGELLQFERIPLFNYKDSNSPNVAATSATWQATFPSSWQFSGLRYTVRYDGAVAEDESGIIKYRYEFQDPDAGAEASNAADIQAGLENAIAQLGYATLVGVVANSTGGATTNVYDISLTGGDAGFEIVITGIDSPDQPILSQITTDAPATEPAWSYTYVVENNSTFYECIVANESTADNEPGVGANFEDVWLDIGSTAPSYWDYQHGGANLWVVDNTYAPWGRGFPTCNVFHDQRLIVMANRDNPTALYGSALGNYNFFQPGVNADDPFIFVLDSSDTPEIKWGDSQLSLLLGTSSGDYVIGADVTLGPTDIQASRQNNARSFRTRPMAVDTDVFYIEQGQTKLRMTQFVRDRFGFSSTDASLLAEQLLYGGIKRSIVLRVPEVMLVTLGTDGQLKVLTYNKENQMAAWSEFTTDGTIVDISGYFSTVFNEDVLYLAVNRNGQFSIETMRYPQRDLTSNLLLTSQNIVHLDNYEIGVFSGDTITGLDHLEGQTVVALVNDAFEGTHLVTGGSITLEETFDFADFAVGLAYTGTLETFENPDNARGTGHGTARRWNRLTTRLLDSALPIIEADRSADRTPATVMGTAEIIRRGERNVEQSNLGFGDGSILFIQDRPYPTHILGYFGEYTVEDR